MLRIFPALLITVFFTGFSQSVNAQGTPVTNFGTNPGGLNCYKYVPANMPANAPLVLVLHGCTQTASSYSIETQWNDLADRQKFYVAYGEQTSTNNSTECFNYFLTADNSRGQGEALSLKQITDYMKANYSIDTTRVFVTGLSAGGAMTAVMCACYPDVFAAGAEMSGLPYGCATSEVGATLACLGEVSNTPQVWGNYARAQNPGYTGNWPRMAMFQGSSDETVNIENSTEMIKQWTNLHGMNQTAGYTNSDFNGNAIVQLEQFFDSSYRVQVEFYEVMDMLHGTAVYPGTCYQQGGATDDLSFDEDFYSPFWAAQFFGILQLPYSMTGLTSVTINQQGLVYSVPNTTGSTYTWIVPTGATIVSGQGTSSVTVNWGNTNGTISVSEMQSDGCIEGPVQLFVTASPAPLTLDAALSNLSSPGSHVCNDSIWPSFTLGNAGSATLTLLTIYYQLDNGALQTYAWSGLLATSQTTVMTLPGLSVTVGSHALLIYSSAPNGSTDVNLANDTLRGSFSASVPPVVNLGGDTSQCGGSIVLNAQNAGNTYAWSTGATTQTITVTQTNTYTVTVTNAQTCAAADSIEVHINAAPVVTLHLLPDTVCESGGLVTLGGGNPTGGIYTGNDISGGVLNPSAAGYGNFTVNYTYTDSNSCHESSSQTIYVVPCSTAVGISDLTSPVDTICAAIIYASFTMTNLGQTNIYTNALYYQVDNGTMQNYTWSGTLAGGHSTVVALPSINTTAGNHVITIISMSDTLSGSFTIGAIPVVNLGNDTALCGGSIILNAQNSGAFYVWSTGASAQSITVSQTGLYSVTVTNTQTCSAADSILVSIDTLPVVTFQLSLDTVCSNANPVVLSGHPNGGIFSGTDVAGNQFNPVTAGSGNYIIGYSYTDSNNCMASVSQNITVETCSSIENVTANPHISIFPNPNSSGRITVNVDAAFIGKTLILYDATGRVVMQYLISSGSGQLNISHLEAGVYLLQVGEEVKKLIAQ